MAELSEKSKALRLTPKRIAWDAPAAALGIAYWYYRREMPLPYGIDGERQDRTIEGLLELLADDILPPDWENISLRELFGGEQENSDE